MWYDKKGRSTGDALNDGDRITAVFNILSKSVFCAVSFNKVFKSISSVANFLSIRAAPSNKLAGRLRGSRVQGTLSAAGDMCILKWEVIVYDFNFTWHSSGTYNLYTWDR